MVSRETYNAIPPFDFTTRALYQAKGVLEETAREKGYDGSEDYIALLPPVTAGWKAFIRVPGGEWIPTRVVDVVRREDEYLEAVWMHSGLELSYTLAARLGDLTPPYLSGVRVCITDNHPERACPEGRTPPDFTDWFRSVLRFEAP